MNVLLIFSVLILIAIAIWQVTKIFELSQGKKVYTQVADDDDNNLEWKTHVWFSVFYLWDYHLFFCMYGDVFCPRPLLNTGLSMTI